jgi:hypothetical protein
MISSTFGAPFGGTIRGAHHGFDCKASFLITPPNFGSGGGSWRPSIAVVALGEPGTPDTPCATAETAVQAMMLEVAKAAESAATFRILELFMVVISTLEETHAADHVGRMQNSRIKGIQ